MLVATGLWAFWGFMEMYYEGWGLPGLAPVAYLIPGVVFAAVWLLAEAWPRSGGWLLILFGTLFTVWVLSLHLRRGTLTVGGLLSWIPVTAMVVMVGVLFLADGRRRRRLTEKPGSSQQVWIRRNRRFVIPPATLFLVGVACTAANWHVFKRVDDGDRGTRFIRGNGVTLVWAPEGPGWAQSGGSIPRNLSWTQIALYGLEPVGFGEKPGYESCDATQEEMERYGLFRYLAVDGVTLEEEPQEVWRMPTVDEIVRSLVRDGENAGCTFPSDRERGRASCANRPDKETPLWASDHPFIYMWAGGEHNNVRAYFVSYNGSVSHQPKSWGNPRHGHRFVRDPLPGEVPAQYSRIGFSPSHGRKRPSIGSFHQ
jgi:hypothetical protein